MGQSYGGTQEVLGTGGNTATARGLCLTHWTLNLAQPGTQKKKKKRMCDFKLLALLTCLSQKTDLKVLHFEGTDSDPTRGGIVVSIDARTSVGQRQKQE